MKHTRLPLLNRARIPIRPVPLAMLAAAWLIHGSADAIVRPTPDRAFGTNAAGENILLQMQREATNPRVAQTVVRLVNTGPNPEFDAWTGTLISSNWILTCAHALQGTNGQGGGIDPADLFWSYGGAIQDPAAAAIAEFVVHPLWQSNAYSAGYDIALMRLAVPVTNVSSFPRLAAAVFQAPRPVVLAGYGFSGDGDSGQLPLTGDVLRVGVNTLDGIGTGVLANGAGQPNVEHVNRDYTIALMDFDKLERREFACGGGGPAVVEIVGLAGHSSMGAENSLTQPVADPCHAPGTLVVSNVFETAFNDFLGASGDSGGPVFDWPNAPAPPATGFYLTDPLTVVGLASSIVYSNSLARSRYGDVGTYTLIEPHLNWIYSVAAELGDRDSDGDGHSDKDERQKKTDPYDATSAPRGFHQLQSQVGWVYEKTFVRAAEAVLQNFRVLSATERGNGLSEVRFTMSVTNPSSVTYWEPAVTLDLVPAGFSLPTNFTDRLLRFTSDLSGTSAIAPYNSAVVLVAAPAADAANLFLASAASFAWSVEGYEYPEFGSNVLVLDASFADSRIRQDAYGFWFSNAPPSLHAVAPGWLVLQGPDLPTNVCAFPPPPFEVAEIQTNEVGEIGLAASTNTLDWLQWLRHATFRHQDIGLKDAASPREAGSHAPGITEQSDDEGNVTNIAPGSPPPNDLLNNFQLEPEVSLSASVGLGKLDTDVDVCIRDSKPCIKFTLRAHPQWTATLRVGGAVTFPRKEREVMEVFLPPGGPGNPFELKVGPFDLEMQLHGRLYHGAEGQANAAAEVTFSQQSDFQATYVLKEGGGSFDYTWTPQPLDLTSPQLELESSLSARFFAGAEIGVVAYLKGLEVPLGSAEAGAYLEPYARVEVQPLNGPSWALYAGLQAGAYATADLLLWTPLDEQYPIFLEEQLVQGTGFAAPAAAAFHQPAPPSATATDPSASPRESASSASATPPHSSSERLLVGTDSRWSKLWPTLYPLNAGYTDRPGLVLAPNESGNALLGSVLSLSETWLAELDRQGNSLWQKTYGGLGLGTFRSVARVPGDGYVMVCGNGDVTVTRLDDLGAVRWSRKYDLGAPVSRFWVDASRDTNGQARLFVSGGQSPTGSGGTAFVLCLDDLGTTLWANGYGTEGNAFATAVRATHDGGLLLAGKCDAKLLRCPDPTSPACTDYAHNGFVAKLDAGGIVQWAAACEANVLYDVVETPEGGALAVGGALTILYDPFRGITAHRFRPDGQLAWQTTYAVDLARSGHPPGAFPVGDTDFDEARGVAVTAGGYVLCGFTGGDAGRYEKSAAWLMRIRENGEPLWYSMWQGPELDHGIQVVDRGDSFLMLGLSGSFLPLGTGGTNAPWLNAVPHSGQLRFKPETGVTTDYRYALVDGFDGRGLIGAQLSSAWSPVTPTITPLIANASTVNVTVMDHWAPATELAQTLHAPPGGRPVLNIDRAGADALVSWPVLGSDGFRPEAAFTVTGPWSVVNSFIGRAGVDWFFQVPATNAQQFFRLRKP